MSDDLRCPECRDGKCRNCTGWTLNAKDETVDCKCDEPMCAAWVDGAWT